MSFQAKKYVCARNKQIDLKNLLNFKRKGSQIFAKIYRLKKVFDI